MARDTDYWHEGFSCGLSAYGWLEVVAGRFLRSHDRRELASGWLCGFREREACQRADAEAASQRARESALASELVAVCDDSEIPW